MLGCVNNMWYIYRNLALSPGQKMPVLLLNILLICTKSCVEGHGSKSVNNNNNNYLIMTPHQISQITMASNNNILFIVYSILL